jgi:hypothetical protein
VVRQGLAGGVKDLVEQLHNSDSELLWLRLLQVVLICWMSLFTFDSFLMYVGSLMYIASCTKPDLCYRASLLKSA